MPVDRKQERWANSRIQIPPMLARCGSAKSPVGGLDLSFLGLAYDGLTLGYQANVLSAVASSRQGHLTVGVEGVENPACR